MAEHLTNAGSNVSSINSDIKAAAREISHLESRIKDIREEIGEIKRNRIKPHINLAEFKIAYRYWMMDDHEDRHDCLNKLRVAFDALQIGQQASMLAAFDD